MEPSEKTGQLNSVINALAHDKAFVQGRFADVVHYITEQAAIALNCERVSVWEFSETPKKQITCIDYWNSSIGSHSKGMVLDEKDAASYINALNKDQVLLIDDVTSDSRCKELILSYLPENNITSMLDAPFQYDGDLAGVICCEHVGKKREWTDSERNFSSNIASLLSIAKEREKRTELTVALEYEKNNLRVLSEFSPDGILIFVDKKIVYANAAVQKLSELLGTGNLIGLTLEDLLDEDSSRAAQMRQDIAMSSGKRMPVMEYILRRNGNEMALEVTSVFIKWNGKNAIQSIIRDISELKYADLTLRNAHKMEAVGQLTGGIAHDFNNLLTIVMGNLELLGNSGEISDKNAVYINNALKASNRGAQLTRKLLSFSRQKETQPEKVDVNDVLENMRDLLSRSLTASIKMNLNLEQDLPAVLLSKGDLEDSILNLVLNARDAMEGAGEIQLSTYMKKKNNELNIVISVKDSGSGIPQEILDKVFEPFFSTKSEEKGSGLGLSMVYAFVQRSGGKIDIHSDVDEGTEVLIYLPVQDNKNSKFIPVD